MAISAETLPCGSGDYRDCDEVISTALSILAEAIENGAVSETRSAELRALGKVK